MRIGLTECIKPAHGLVVIAHGADRDRSDFVDSFGRHMRDAFPIVRRKDEQQYGEYRTKRVILEIYNEMQRAITTGQPYRTRLDPPPADPLVAHALGQ
jgi:hypothetical protein